MEILFPVIGAVFVFLLVLGFAVFMRYLDHKETLALAEKGLIKPEKTRSRSRGIFRWGIIFIAVGFILIMVLLPFAWNRFWLLLLIGLLPLLIGLSLLMVYVLMQDAKTERGKQAPSGS